MNKNRKVSEIEAKLIADYLNAKNIEYSEINQSEVFHKDDEVIIRFTDKKAKEKMKTLKATELIAFAYSKSKSIDSGEILKEVQKLVTEKLEKIQEAVMNEIENLKKSTQQQIEKSLQGKEVDTQNIENISAA